MKGDIAKLSTRIDGVEKLMDTQYKAIRDQKEALNKSVLSAIGELKAIIDESRAQAERWIESLKKSPFAIVQYVLQLMVMLWE